MTETGKKKKIITAAITAGIFSALLLIPVIKTSISETEYIMTDTEGKFYRAKKMFVCGSSIICMKGLPVENDRANLPPAEDSEYSLSILSMNNLKNIEIITGTVTGEAVTPAADGKYLGMYRIRLQGYSGTLHLWAKDNKLYGTVRFPEWGKGAMEYLKGVKISGGSISFTRSANSLKEINRLGANSYFTQRFSGRYSNSGKNISGFFMNDRKEKHQWDADR